MTSVLEQYRITDFLEWHKERKLILNPEFQRGSVWTPSARSFLIDTILRRLPIPKIYLRTRVDVSTHRSLREVVDGQQRLRAIIDFANNEFSLNKRAEEYSGKRYSTLELDEQEAFLSYPIAVDQLINASDEDVLEVFARLNSYNVTLNPAELRHAKYQGEFKWTVRNKAHSWSVLWEKYQVVRVRERVRMQDDSLMAELFGVILKGVTDGGQSRINRLYDGYDKSFDPADESVRRVDDVLEYILTNLADYLLGTPVLSAPHFLMLFAAVAHARHGIPGGDMGERMPARDESALSDINNARENVLEIASVLSSDRPVPKYEDFWTASQKSTQRISSRRIRFPVFYNALIPVPKGT